MTLSSQVKVIFIKLSNSLLKVTEYRFKIYSYYENNLLSKSKLKKTGEEDFKAQKNIIFNKKKKSKQNYKYFSICLNKIVKKFFS